MRNNTCWKDNSNEHAVQFDFVPPKNWNADHVDAEQHSIAQTLIDLGSNSLKREAPSWIGLAKKLPQELLRVLIQELNSGNKMMGIGSSNWPSEGSIVVNLCDRFGAASHTASGETKWRRLDDPHYCREEVSQMLRGVEYLIIA